MILCRPAVLALVAVLAQPAPPGWKSVKDENGVCRMELPRQWKADAVAGMYSDAKKATSAMLAQETVDAFKVLSAAELNALKAVRVFENSSKRIFVEGQPNRFRGITTRPWDVWIPAAKGSCHIVLSLQPGADEEIARRIAASLRAIR